MTKKTKAYRHVTVHLPIFVSKVFVHFEQTRKLFINRCLRVDPDGDYRLVSCVTQTAGGSIYVIMSPEFTSGDLAHECLHAAHAVLNYIGAVHHDEEVVAYVMQHIHETALGLR